MPQSYSPEFKKKIVRLRLEDGRTMKSISTEYGIAKSSISKWCSEFSQECQEKKKADPTQTSEIDLMKENLRLKRELEEKNKEINFLKKAAAFFAKEIG